MLQYPLITFLPTTKGSTPPFRTPQPQPRANLQLTPIMVGPFPSTTTHKHHQWPLKEAAVIPDANDSGLNVSLEGQRIAGGAKFYERGSAVEGVVMLLFNLSLHTMDSASILHLHVRHRHLLRLLHERQTKLDELN
ncbi:hypothetical protein E2C01_067772 [Portunus trituberculatus]|uniref:Uncharacterized protein n=1 Tax=Portunus trituberculatus TaxID=210409 RepID=A0A5B7HTS9_PORTR|nr:hypothetical protein [Portunus trituberculatus]